jgi:hypothetical protein
MTINIGSFNFREFISALQNLCIRRCIIFVNFVSIWQEGIGIIQPSIFDLNLI